MGDNLPLSRVLCSVPGVEQTPSDTDKRIVKLGLQESVAMAVNFVDSGVVRDGDVVGRDSDEFAVLLVLVVDDLVSVATSCLPGEPELGDCGWEGSRVFAETVRVEDEWDQDGEELYSHSRLAPVVLVRIKALTATAMTTGIPTIGSDSRWMRSATCCKTTLSGMVNVLMLGLGEGLLSLK
jgi:hypothetical protein